MTFLGQKPNCLSTFPWFLAYFSILYFFRLLFHSLFINAKTKCKNGFNLPMKAYFTQRWVCQFPINCLVPSLLKIPCSNWKDFFFKDWAMEKTTSLFCHLLTFLIFKSFKRIASCEANFFVITCYDNFILFSLTINYSGCLKSGWTPVWVSDHFQGLKTGH